MADSFPNLMKIINLVIQETQHTPSKLNTKKNTARHTIIKLLQTDDKEEILKSTRGGVGRGWWWGDALQEIKIRIYADFTLETMQARRLWSKISMC